MRISGYDPDTNICWQFRNKGDKGHCQCPICSAGYPNRLLVGFGRCHSGQRWFWVASTWLIEDKLEAFGWADTEEQAIDAAIIAVRDIRYQGGKPVIAFFRQGDAAHKLKQLNKAKRAARPAPDTSDAHIVDYLYGSWWDGEDGKSLPYRFRITKKTAKRIFYSRSGEQIDDFGEPQWVRDRDNEIGYVNRQKLEADGEVDNRGVHWCQPDSHLYISLQRLLADIRRHEREPSPDLLQLKAEMAAAHPDRGGSSAEFIAARTRYVAARRRTHAESKVRS